MTDLQQQIDALTWYHQLDFGPGYRSPPAHTDPRRKLARLRLPESLTGKSVLDVGARDGFYSFEALRRGARRVLAVDGPAWATEKPASHPTNSATKRTFDLANTVIAGGAVESMVDYAESLTVDRVGRFDVVLFLGILYHCPDPIRALGNMADIAGELLIVETETDLLFNRRPALAYYRGRGATHHPGDWCGPNNAFVVDFLRDRGFAVEHEETYGVLARMARAGVHALRSRANPLSVVQRGRSVFWARR